jgi:hypothetical protein
MRLRSLNKNPKKQNPKKQNQANNSKTKPNVNKSPTNNKTNSRTKRKVFNALLLHRYNKVGSLSAREKDPQRAKERFQAIAKLNANKAMSAALTGAHEWLAQDPDKNDVAQGDIRKNLRRSVRVGHQRYTGSQIKWGNSARPVVGQVEPVTRRPLQDMLNDEIVILYHNSDTDPFAAPITRKFNYNNGRRFGRDIEFHGATWWHADPLWDWGAGYKASRFRLIITKRDLDRALATPWFRHDDVMLPFAGASTLHSQGGVLPMRKKGNYFNAPNNAPNSRLGTPNAPYALPIRGTYGTFVLPPLSVAVHRKNMTRRNTYVKGVNGQMPVYTVSLLSWITPAAWA